MMIKPFAGASLVLALGLSACGVTPHDGSPHTVIAVGADGGVDKLPLPDQRAAIAYDPDGCQNWIIDDGVEGYASPRFDPATGMANVCNSHFPPGAVVKDYQSGNQGISDYVPVVRRKQ